MTARASWASHAIEKLQRGETAQVTPRGNSMRPRIESGALVTLEPYPDDVEPAVGDAVLVRHSGKVYLHLVKALRGPVGKRQYQIGNNRGGINGWVRRPKIYGRATQVVQPSQRHARRLT